MEFQGKIVLVTGGASGIGRAVAFAFAQRGAKIIIADLDADKGEETIHDLEAENGNARFIRTNVGLPDDVEALFSAINEEHGALHFAVNSAGIEGLAAPIIEQPEEIWDKVTTINLKGVWLCMKHEIIEMLKQKRGSIVNIASVAGLRGFPQLSPYVASKFGVVGITRSVAIEYARLGVRVNAVCPGDIRTPMYERYCLEHPEYEALAIEAHPLGRIGEPLEVAEAAVWLCSDAASFITGQALAVDGGFVA